MKIPLSHYALGGVQLLLLWLCMVGYVSIEKKEKKKNSDSINILEHVSSDEAVTRWYWEYQRLAPAGMIGLIFTRSWLADPHQPIQWAVLHHVMPCSVFKWGAGWKKDICYPGASWASGGENITCCIFFLLVVLLFSLPFTVLLNWFCHN